MKPHLLSVALRSCLEDERETRPPLSQKVPCSRGKNLTSSQSPGENLWERDQSRLAQWKPPWRGALLRGNSPQWEHFPWEQSSEDTVLGGGGVSRGSSPQGTPHSCGVGGSWSPGGVVRGEKFLFLLAFPLSVDPGSLSEPDCPCFLPVQDQITRFLTLSKDAVTHSNASPHQPMCDLWRDPVSSKNFSKCVKNMTRPPERPSPCSSNHTMLAAGPGE